MEEKVQEYINLTVISAVKKYKNQIIYNIPLRKTNERAISIGREVIEDITTGIVLIFSDSGTLNAVEFYPKNISTAEADKWMKRNFEKHRYTYERSNIENIIITVHFTEKDEEKIVKSISMTHKY